MFRGHARRTCCCTAAGGTQIGQELMPIQTRTDCRAGVPIHPAEWDLWAMVVASDGHEGNPQSPECLVPRSRPSIAAQKTIIPIARNHARGRPVSPSHPLDLLSCVSDALPLTPRRRTSCLLTRDTTICQLQNHQNDVPICSWECGHLQAVGVAEVWARAKTTSIPAQTSLHSNGLLRPSPDASRSCKVLSNNGERFSLTTASWRTHSN